LFLEAIRYVHKNSPKKIKAFIVGGGEEMEALLKKVADMGLTEKVIFTSWEKEVHKIYPGLDIVCLTSFNEGTPVSLIEAQAANKPIVSTNVGGIEDVVIPNGTALLSEITDKEQFYRNLHKLVDEDALREKMGQQGWNHVKEKYSFVRLESDMKKLYASLKK
jgi:glycosyltransferase involved in cell wall biosynthesis